LPFLELWGIVVEGLINVKGKMKIIILMLCCLLLYPLTANGGSLKGIKSFEPFRFKEGIEAHPIFLLILVIAVVFLVGFLVWAVKMPKK
jgi:Na+-transporting NADH:ubiquinone oxidoreductase subunit NqrD